MRLLKALTGAIMIIALCGIIVASVVGLYIWMIEAFQPLVALAGLGLIISLVMLTLILYAIED